MLKVDGEGGGGGRVFVTLMKLTVITQSCVYSFSELRAVADISGRGNYEFEREGSVAIKRLKSDGN